MESAFAGAIAQRGAVAQRRVILRTESGDTMAELERGAIEGLDDSAFFTRFLSPSFNREQLEVRVTRTQFPFMLDIMAYLTSPQPLFVDRLVGRGNLSSALAAHHCALFFLADSPDSLFGLEFFYVIWARRALLVQASVEWGFPVDQLLFAPSSEGHDFLHLPLRSMLMWLAALQAREVAALHARHGRHAALYARAAACGRALCHARPRRWQIVR